jgi:16S rRNA processing protein RimM
VTGARRRRVCLGAFAGAHGVKGDLKLRAFTAEEENVAAYGPLESEDGRRFQIKVVRILKPGFVVARAREVATREDAERLAGIRLYVDRDRLPPASEGEYYIEDLVGLAALDETGARLGDVAAVHDFGAGPVLELRRSEGRGPVFIPFSDAAVPAIAVNDGRITVLKGAVAAAERGESGDGPP